jgi:membrane protease YdiL (CAAX protease family)
MQESEEMARTIIDQMIAGKTWTSYLSNLLIIAVAAGIAEEFFFRGILYFLLGKVIKNRHTVIWIIAFIFSAVHLQFYGFLPRMLLGAYLGYLLLSSNNIWLPVLSHILNNALVLTAMYLPPLASTTLFADTLSNTEILWMGIISLPSLFALRYCLKAIKRN